jgi:hypothetical protein
MMNRIFIGINTEFSYINSIESLFDKQLNN